MNTEEQKPPSPQTGEKDEVLAKMKNIPERIFLNIGDEAELVDDFKMFNGEYVCWCEDKIDDHDIEYVRAYKPHQPPAAQSDQEAAEKWADESIDPWRSSQETFLAGCTHVRSQQQEDAVAFAEWIIENVPSFQIRRISQ